MQYNAGSLALLTRPTQQPVRAARPAPFVPEGVTVCVPGAVLAPAPTTPAATEAPVFVDDSGARKRMLRIVGVLLGLFAISFLGVVGVALATPTVDTSVGLGNVTPFVVPGAAAAPPARTPAAPQAPVHVSTPKTKTLPAHVVAPKQATAAPQPAPSHDEPVSDSDHHSDKGDKGDKGHHGTNNDTTDDHGQHSTTTTGGQNNPTGDQAQQSTSTGQTSQTQQGQQAPAQPDAPAAPAVDTNANANAQ